jgi:hypothetical protein
MKKLLILLTLAFASHVHSTPIETDSMDIIFKTALQKINQHGAENVLIVFDIDNTLLTANQDFSSYAWNLWQKKLIKEKLPHSITDSMNKFYKIENVLFSMGNMHTPEEFIANSIKELQSSGVSVIALTSRGPQMRSTTERVLKNNTLSFNNVSFNKGFPGAYTPKYGKGRSVSFQNGIYMTAGQNKGLMLKDLLERVNKDYKSIIFTDDLSKHTIHMEEVFEYMGEDIVTFRYGKMDKQIKEFNEKNKREVVKQWQNLRKVWKDIFD